MSFTNNPNYVPTSTDVGFGRLKTVTNEDSVYLLSIPPVGNIAYDFVLTSDCLIQLPVISNHQIQVITLRLSQSDGGGYRPAFDDHIQWANGVVPELNTKLYCYDVIQFVSIGNQIWTATPLSMNVFQNVLVFDAPTQSFLTNSTVTIMGKYYGTTPTGFEIQYGNGDWIELDSANAVIVESTHSCTLSFLSPTVADTYTVQIRAKNIPMTVANFVLKVYDALVIAPNPPILTATPSAASNSPYVTLEIRDTSDNGSPIIAHQIYRATSPQSGVLIGTLASPGLVYVDSNVVNGNRYFYTVKSVNIAGASEFSTEVSAFPTAPVVTNPTTPVYNDVIDTTPSARALADPNFSNFVMGTNIAELGNGSGSVVGNNVSPASFSYAASKGIKNVRMPGRWERLQKTLMAPLEPIAVQRYLDALAIAHSHGQKVLLEPLHNYGEYTDYSLATPKRIYMGGGELLPEHFADFWTKFATVMKDQPNILGYDILNEPHDLIGKGATWQTFAQAAITAIRKVDMVTPIYVEGYQWSTAYNFEKENPNLHLLVDPADNLVFSPHLYLDMDSSGSTSRNYGNGSGPLTWDGEVGLGDIIVGTVLDADTGRRRLNSFNRWLRKHNLRGAIGECGVMNTDPRWLYALNNTIEYCRSAKIQFFYWASGTDFRNYSLGIEPTGEKDTVQMAVLSTFTGAPSNNIYYMSGPASGGVNTVSAPFKIDYRGILSAPVVVTPNDGGKGGVFTPSSVTLTPGYNAVASFTYTPTTSGLRYISVTNNGNLRNPTQMGFSTVTDLFTSQINPTTGVKYIANNVFSLRRLVSSYIGPAITLQRSSDRATNTFYFNDNNDNLDIASIQEWAGTDTLIVERWYDQSGANRHLGTIVGTSNRNSPDGKSALLSSDADKPRFLVSGGANNKPTIRWSKNRMDCSSPIHGNAAMTVMAVTNVASPTTGFLCSWNIIQSYSFLNGGRTMQMYDEPAVDVGVDAGFWHSYTGTYKVKGQINTYRDSALLNTANSTTANTSIVFTYANNADGTPNTNTAKVTNAIMNVGYYLYYPIFYSGDICEMVIYNGELAPQHIKEWTNNQNYWGVAVPPVAAQPTISNITAESATLSWDNTDAVDYIVQFKSTSAASYTSANGGNPVSSGPFTITDLNANTQYTFRLWSRATQSSYSISNLITAKTGQKAAGSGDAIPYIGMNVSQLENGLMPITRQAKQIRSITRQLKTGYNLVRIPFRWQYLQPTLFGPIDQTYLAILLSYVAEVLKTPGAVAVLDSHDYAERKVDGGTVLYYIGRPDSPLTTASFVDYWTKVANIPEFKNNDRVWLGINNEPKASEAIWIGVVQAVVDGIRSSGANNLLLLPTSGGSSSRNLTTGGVNYFTCWKDPLNNYAIEVHQYIDSGSAGVKPITGGGFGLQLFANAMHGRRLAKKLCDGLGVFCPKLFYGEVGFDTGAESLRTLRVTMDLVQNHADDVLAWVFWSAGDAFAASYVYNMNPVINGVADPVNGIDLPQVPIIQGYMAGGENYKYNRPTSIWPAYSVNTNLPVEFNATGPFPGTVALSSGQLYSGSYGPMGGNSQEIGHTVEFWFKANSLPTAECSLFGSSSTMRIYMNSNGTLGAYYGYSVRAQVPATAATYADGKWHHLQFSVSATGAQLYVDGVLSSSKNTPFTAVNLKPATGLGIGGAGGSSTTIFPGALAHFVLRIGVKNTTNFTRPTAPPTGYEKDVMWYLSLNGTLDDKQS